MEAAVMQKHADAETPPVVHTADVAIVGGGLAGSLAAAMLGRAGIDAILIDPHTEYPPDFRCEKLDGDQVKILRKTGLADAILRACTPDRETWVARFGHLVEKRPGDQQGIYYTPLVNAVRAEIPKEARFLQAKATALATSADRQAVTLSTGDIVQARLIVLANGLNIGLRDSLGLKREVISACHSISIGFDMEPVGRRQFEFPALFAKAAGIFEAHLSDTLPGEKAGDFLDACFLVKLVNTHISAAFKAGLTDTKMLVCISGHLRQMRDTDDL